MVENSTISIAAVTAILGTLLILGGVTIYEGEDVYLCEYRALVTHCDRLSATHKTCYNSEIGNKVCRHEPYWQRIEGAKDTIYANNSFVMKYNYTFANKTVYTKAWKMVDESVPTYKMVDQEVQCNTKNASCVKCTTEPYELCVTEQVRVIDQVSTKQVNKSYIIETQVVDVNPSKITSVTINGDKMNSKYEGGIYVQHGVVHEMLVPPGERNWLEFPCSDREVEKGACKRTYIGGDEQ